MKIAPLPVPVKSEDFEWTAYKVYRDSFGGRSKDDIGAHKQKLSAAYRSLTSEDIASLQEEADKRNLDKAVPSVGDLPEPVVQAE